ncbi:MAG TPA: DNA polymerase III subunit gamma/tau [Burkholderiales bacterium]|jgi:DNA polymerase-3 subunit gamma/tau|nr:DNA polymerase III subunit gamma/tau [Burkholderiales bacterium]
MTLALARKWRPRDFSEMVGQEHVVKALTNALEQNRLHHAWLLTGTRGVGKTTLARILAKALNCATGVTSRPCGQCAACTEIDAGRFVDLLELDAASNTQVDNMRELLENAMYAPTVARYKVYIIDEVHMLSRSAFNAMLKTLEEPPAHVKFILATTEAQKIPVTVLSRCLQFNLKQIPAAQIRARLERILQEERIGFEGPAVALLARAAQGSLRDALSLLDQAIAHGAGKVEEAGVREMLGAVDRGHLVAILRALADRDAKRLIAEADRMAQRSLSFDTALEELASLLHRLALAQTLPETLPEDEPEREALGGLAASFSPEDVQLMYQIALLGRRDLGLAPDEYGGFTMTLLRMLSFVPLDAGGALPRGQAAQAGSAPQEPTPSAELGDWRSLIGQLKLGGMARMLAEHCELERFEADAVELKLPQAHRHLFEKAYAEKLQAALQDRLGKQVRVRIRIGGGDNTPAAQEDRERQQRLQRAVEAIDSDPFVRDLVENFDARVIDSSIKPIQ